MARPKKEDKRELLRNAGVIEAMEMRHFLIMIDCCNYYFSGHSPRMGKLERGDGGMWMENTSSLFC